MKKIFYLIIISIPAIGLSQEPQVHFEKELTWEQTKEKAKAEQKLIFVDCYATWCKPCKEMDKNVYTNTEVGNLINGKFISLRLQMDSSKMDEEYIKRLYPLAREFAVKYKVIALPTLLFFAPNGEALDKKIGSQTVAEFIEMVKEVENPNKQLYTQVKECRSGVFRYDSMPQLINKLRQYGEDSLASEIAKMYMHNYLDKLNDGQFCTIDNILFFHYNANIITSTDRIFSFYFNKPVIVDSVAQRKGYARSRVNYIITKNDIMPFINDAARKDGDPNWSEIEKIVKEKYGESYAIVNVINSKENWYYTKKKWDVYLKTVLDRWHIFGRNEFSKYDWGYLNTIAWTACVHTNNKNVLKIALKWIDIGLSKDNKPNEAMLDTKANILYKLEHTREAIKLIHGILVLYEAKLQTAKESEKEYYKGLINEYHEKLIIMRKGEEVKLYD